MTFEKWVALVVIWFITFLLLVINQRQKPMITEGGIGFILYLPYVAVALFIADVPLLLVDWLFNLTAGFFIAFSGVWAWILIFFNKKISLVVEKFFEKIT